MAKNKILKRIVAGLSCIALSTTMLTSLPAFADDYVDEYQYYSTLDPNGEEYQEWKSNLASSAVSVPQNRMLKSILKNNTLIANDYIEFNTASNGHYTIGTIGGNPNSSTDDNKKMLFGHPGGGTSKTTIVVGESINEFTSSNVTYDADGSKSVSKASYDGVDVTQELSIIENSATGRDDVVKIKYIVKNDTEYAKQVGIRIMMDTMLGGNDAAPFRVNGSDVTTETVYSGSNIPQIWQAFDSATNPGVVAQGTFYKSGDRKPDKVQFTNWGNVTSTLWDYVTQPGRSNADNKENLEYHCDWLAVDNQYLGNTSVCEFVNDDYGNTYAKIKFNTDVELQPNKQFVIHFRLNAADWSNWDTSNDYSMGTEQLLPNDKIIVFYNEQLISGVQP